MILTVINASTGNKLEISADPSDTVASLLEKIKAGTGHQGDARLITDGSRQIHKISLNDPVNRWHDGQVGDIYRIEDRYRRVAPISSKK